MAGVTEKLIKQLEWTSGSEYEQVKSVRNLPSDFGESGQVAMDVEGPPTSKSYGREAIYSVQLCDREKRAFYAKGEEAAKLAQWAVDMRESRGLKLIMHNAKTDTLALEQEDVRLVVDEDTMLMTFLADPNDSSGLKSASARYLSINHPEWSPAVYSTEKIFGRYGCGDAEITLRLRNELAPRMNETAMKLEMKLIPVLVEMERNGLLVDSKRLKKLEYAYKHIIEKVRQKLIERVGREFDANSSQQVGTVLFEDMGLECRRRTKTGRPSTDKNTLKGLATKYPIVKEILLFRRLTKKLGTYVSSVWGHMDENDRVYQQILQSVTPTKRLAGTKPNLMNQPKRAETAIEQRLTIRDIFVADPGHVMVSVDYSQIEFRAMIFLSKSNELIERMIRGEDFHKTTAMILTQKAFDELTKEDRENGKTFNYGISYGMDKSGIAYRLGCAAEEATRIAIDHKKNYIGIYDWKETEEAWALKKGMSRTMLGPLRELPDLRSPSKWDKQKALRNVINDQIQGTAAEIFKMGLIRLVRQKEDWMRILVPVHDEVLLEVPEDSSTKEVSAVVKETMEVNLGKMGTYPVDLKVGRNWGKMHEVKKVKDETIKETLEALENELRR